MGNEGYIYVLINPSMKDIVKIGKTTRDPVERVNEISSATGVPTPFILVYQQLFEDCTIAEEHIHSLLDKFRVSINKEFFNLPVYEAISCIQNLTNKNPQLLENPQIRDTNLSKLKNNTNISKDLYNKGLNALFGINDELQDYKESIKLFKQASKMQDHDSYRMLGILHWKGLGVKKDNDKMINYLKKGASLGSISCYGLLGIIYMEEEEVRHYKNSQICWNHFFSHISSTTQTTLIEIIYAFEYIRNTLAYNNEISHKNTLKKLKLDLLKLLEDYKFIESKSKLKWGVKEEIKLLLISTTNIICIPFQDGEIPSWYHLVFNKEIKRWGIYKGTCEIIEKGKTIKAYPAHKIELLGDKNGWGTVLDVPDLNDVMKKGLAMNEDEEGYFDKIQKVIVNL